MIKPILPFRDLEMPWSAAARKDEPINHHWADFGAWESWMSVMFDQPCLEDNEEDCRCFNCSVYRWWEEDCEVFQRAGLYSLMARFINEVWKLNM